MKILIHNRAKKNEPIKKVLYYKGKHYNHFIIIPKTVEHSFLIQKMLKHFNLTDYNCKAGLLTPQGITFYGDKFTEFYDLRFLKFGIKKRIWNLEV